ncbi:hypothetical protein FN846DRAFT_291155 [Sphaerosporella brunnea]|uniref:Uncharacterized protein n=1 Tax=Sphaerosporella brunnea TaxID=1250544 RepID=A0A5J5ELL2_9PEZI|nr:hypothetical protein FN846DRAFT_291155 [Sphaerosporella brunnea]
MPRGLASADPCMINHHGSNDILKLIEATISTYSSNIQLLSPFSLPVFLISWSRLPVGLSELRSPAAVLRVRDYDRERLFEARHVGERNGSDSSKTSTWYRGGKKWCDNFFLGVLSDELGLVGVVGFFVYSVPISGIELTFVLLQLFRRCNL